MKLTPRRTVGLILSWPESGPYQRDLLAGAHRAALDRDVNILVLPPEVLLEPENSFAHCHLGGVAPGTLDGCVVATATLVGPRGLEPIAEALAAWRSLPLVSLGEQVSGIPSILLDNHESFSHLLDHLFGVHHYKNPVFVSGPLWSADARIRLRAFEEALVRHGLETSRDRVYSGDFQFSTGVAAVQYWLSGQRRRPDVLICANDNMAQGAYHELMQQGLAVPEDVAVTGFDDLAFSDWLVSPLTTVRQPIDRAGEQAVHWVCDLIEGKEHALSTLATEALFRRSCGCQDTPQTDAGYFHLRNILALHARSDQSRNLEFLFMRFHREFQETGVMTSLFPLEARMLRDLSLPWWYLCYGESPLRGGPRPQWIHIARAEGEGTEAPYHEPERSDERRFPEGLGLEDRWTALQLPLADSETPLGALVVPYVPGFHDRYETLRNRLSGAIGGMRVTKHLRDLNLALTDASRKLEELTLTDELTGTHNRRGFVTLGHRELASSFRRRVGVVVMFIDLDGLKAINDQWGHAAGDEAIRTFSRVLGQSIRETDLMARLGGDEFAVLIPDDHEETVDQVRDRIDQHLLLQSRRTSRPWQLAFSLGSCHADSSQALTLDEMMKRADNELYAEKMRKRSTLQSS